MFHFHAIFCIISHQRAAAMDGVDERQAEE